MTLTNTEAVTDLSILEALDFEPGFECEHSGHDRSPIHGGPGWALIATRCTQCGTGGQIIICRSAYENAGNIRHLACGAMWMDRDECWTIIKVLR